MLSDNSFFLFHFCLFLSLSLSESGTLLGFWNFKILTLILNLRASITISCCQQGAGASVKPRGWHIKGQDLGGVRVWLEPHALPLSHPPPQRPSSVTRGSLGNPHGKDGLCWVGSSPLRPSMQTSCCRAIGSFVNSSSFASGGLSLWYGTTSDTLPGGAVACLLL